MGVFICIVILRKTEKHFIKQKKLHLVSGNYYEILSDQNELEGQGKGEEHIELAA